MYINVVYEKFYAPFINYLQDQTVGFTWNIYHITLLHSYLWNP
jgi:hypothetical protein